ncbi:MAG: hypothetical protein K8S23_16210 [Candidatus Cloacimonetes bacterium]|nr:hypothetical protein [Candidatus Cloacimonadota bacterium]
MKGKISFSHIEKEYLHEMRNKINNSENKSDLKNHFSFTILNMLEEVFEEKEVELNGDDVLFDPKAEKYFILSSSLKDQVIFQETWKGSDLPNVIGRFAYSTYHRYLHLDKHLEKTERKIRN